MTIAVNTRFLLGEYLEGYGNFIFESFSRLASKHADHQFIYIFDRPFDPRFITSKNIKPVVAGPPARHPLLWHYWYNYKLPRILRRYKADILVSPDGCCSLRTKVPQCIVVHDLSFIHYPEFMIKSHVSFYKRYTPFFLKKAKSIITVSESSKKDIENTYGIDGSKIDVVYNGVKNVFNPISEVEKEIIKEKYTEGKEFFLCAGSIHPRKNLINLLKAFSIFKKRQKSNMQLLIIGRKAWKYEGFFESLGSYKYATDVKVQDYLPDNELAKIMAAAYALIYPSFFEGFGVPTIEAMKAEVPVLASNINSIREICDTAAIYFDPNNYENIADSMMKVFKDENKRKELIQEGKKRALKFNWNNTSDLVWESILKTMNC